MTIVSYLSEIIIPFVIVFVIGYGIVEKKNVYDIFIKGAKNGVKIVIKLFPTLLAIFLAINMLRNSGLVDFIINLVKPILNILNISILLCSKLSSCTIKLDLLSFSNVNLEFSKR